MREFDTQTIQMITIFEKITGIHVRDCLVNGEIYYLVNSDQKPSRTKISLIQNILHKKIRIFKYASDQINFVSNLISGARKVEIRGRKAIVYVEEEHRGKVIGKGGTNIKKIRTLLKRNSDIDDIVLSSSWAE